MWWKTVYQLEWTHSLLPSNATPWERVLEAVDADLVARDPVALIPAARSAEQAPVALLPYLAAERSVDEFSGAWPQPRQRAVIAGSLAYHKVKGTRAALDRALSPLGYSVRVVEWFESSVWRPPYTFRINVRIAPDVSWTSEDRALLLRTANAAKNAHTLMAGIDIARRHSGVVFVGAKFRRRRVLRVGQLPKPTTYRQSSLIFLGAVLHRRRTLRIGARQ